MSTCQEKYSPEININYRLWHDSQGNRRPYKPYKPHLPVISINTYEQSLIEKVESTLAALPSYAELEKAAIAQNSIVDISEHLSLPDGYIPFLENDTSPIRKPTDKPTENGFIYNRPNWRLRVGTTEDIIKRLEMGLAVSMGICDRCGDTIRQGVLWYGACGMMLDCDEFNDGTEQKANRPKPCKSGDAFLNQHPQIKDIAHYLIPSSRSLWQGRPFKGRALATFEIPIWDYRVYQKIADKLNSMFAFLPGGVTKNGIAAAFGAAHNADKARRFDGCISQKFIHNCIDEVVERAKQQQVAKQQRQVRDKASAAARKAQDKLKTQLKDRGYDIQDTTSPIKAFMEAVNPVDFMLSEGWITHLGGNDYHWHESGAGKSCEIDNDNGNETVIKPFSNSMQTASPNAEKPVGGHRFILYNLYGLDVNNDADKKQLRKLLAEDGYGTHPDDYKTIKAAEQKAAKAEGLNTSTTTTPNLEADAQFVQNILDDTLDIPDIAVRETPSYQYWTPEQRILCERVLGRDPDDGWHESPTGVWTPAVTTKYQNLHKMTNKDPFKINGQPPDIEKRRIFFTQPGVCSKCHDVAVLSIDKYKLTAHEYCPQCDTDKQIGSYLNHELKRKVPNAVVSKFQGFLGDNPDFESFELFRPEQLTYLGAAMATGKTTEISKAIIRLVKALNKRGIIAVPRVSLARAIAHVFRQQHGYEAWGLWHEGSGRQNQFIGTYGAIVCLPSLSRAVTEAKEQGFGIEDLLIAIDELDFSYQLLSLATATKLKTKQILQEAVETNGIVVAGQTESTLPLESFAAELGLQPEDIHGFYNTAPPAEGHVEIRTYPDEADKTDVARADAVENIRQILRAGKNVYVFCQERRDVMMLADIFEAQNPVLYTAYHKGDARADAVLYNQKVTDTQLFLATSAAGIGINVHDKNAETVILAGALYGQRDIFMIIQETVRNRARTKVTLYLPPITTSLPISPTETENISLYEQGLKIFDKSNYKALPEDSIKRLARSTALATLADNDPMTAFRHHIASTAGMKIVENHVDLDTVPNVKQVKEARAKTRTDEREAATERMLEIIDAPILQVMTSTEIRAAGTAGKLTPMPIEQLAQERINHAAQALGWDDTETDDFSFIDRAILKELCLTINDYRELNQQYKGWTHVHHNEWVHQQFEQKLKQNQHEEGLTAEQGALEITDIEDTRTTGALITQLLDTLQGKTYTETTLAQTVRDILKKRHGNDTFMTLITNGALGVKEYKAARFLHTASDEGIVKWTRYFVKKWYPVRIAKNKDIYYLTPQSDAELKLKVFQQWFAIKSEPPDDDFDGQSPPFIDGFCEPPDPRNEQKTLARQIVADGATAKVAAEKTGLPYNLVCEITKDIRDAAKVEQIETTQKLLTGENSLSLQDIATQLAVNKSTVSRRGQVETEVTCKVTSLHDSLSISNCTTRNWNFMVNRATNVTLQDQILKALSAGEKTTGDIIKNVDGQPTSIKNRLKKLTDDKQIIKVKHGTYALPSVPVGISEPVLNSVDQTPVEQMGKMSITCEKDLWYVVYMIYIVLSDKKKYTSEEIAALTEIPCKVTDASLDFMDRHMLVHVGTSDTYDMFWLDDDTQKRCFEFAVSNARLPHLVETHYFLYHTLKLQGRIEYWENAGKQELIKEMKSKGVVESDFEQVLNDLDKNVSSMRESLIIIKNAALVCKQKAITEIKLKQKYI